MITLMVSILPSLLLAANEIKLTRGLLENCSGAFPTRNLALNDRPDSGEQTNREGAKAAAGEKIGLRVLYCGQPRSSREKDFVDFLGRHLAKVGTGNLNTFRPKDAEGYDVILLDYDELKVVDNTIQSPPNPFMEKYTRPVITLGATGALMCDRWRLKTGYL